MNLLKAIIRATLSHGWPNTDFDRVFPKSNLARNNDLSIENKMHLERQRVRLKKNLYTLSKCEDCQL